MLMFTEALIKAKLAAISERTSWVGLMGGSLVKGISSKVFLAVEGDEIRLVAVKNLHGGGSAAFISTVYYQEFYMNLVR